MGGGHARECSVLSQPLTINLNRGLKGLAEGLADRLPAGRQVMNAGLREVLNRAIDQNPQTPDRDFTALALAEHLGIVQPEKPKRIAAPRRRKR